MAFQMSAIIAGSIIFNIPRLVDDYVVTFDNDTRAKVVNTRMRAQPDYKIIYSGVIYYVVIYAVPMISLIILTQRLIVSIKKFYSRLDQATVAGRAENDLTVTLVVVIIVFILCKILNPIRRLLIAVLPADQTLCGTPYSYLRTLTSFAIVFDSSVHFFIYSMCDCRFRGRLRQRLAPAVGMVALVRGSVQAAILSRVGPSSAGELEEIRTSGPAKTAGGVFTVQQVSVGGKKPSTSSMIGRSSGVALTQQ